MRRTSSPAKESGLRAEWRHRIALSLLAATVLVACGESADAPSRKGAPPELSEPAGVSNQQQRRASTLPRFGTLVEDVGPAVVDIVTTRSLSLDAGFVPPEVDPSDILRRLVPPDGGEVEFRGRELGSGFVIRADGYILTSAHVVYDSEEVVVRFPATERELPATLVGVDRSTDVALLKVDEPTPSVVKFGASKDLEVGDWVAAIGSPFGFSNTITAGIVSATQRALPNESFVSFIQTDVAVNPGSSGGPLLNLKGEVVGINSIIYSRTGGYMGVSFAIPIEVALDVSEQLRERGFVTRGRIGVQTQPLTEKLARSFKTPATEGVLVAAVEAPGPAARANLQAGDVILKYNGTRVATVEELSRLVAQSAPGSKSTLEIWRNGKRQELSLLVGEMPAEKPVAAPTRPAADSNRLGLVLQDAPIDQRRELGLEYGLLVESAQGPANVSGLQPGDVITTFNQLPLTSRRQFEKLLTAQEGGSMIALRVFRGRDAVYVAVRVPD